MSLTGVGVYPPLPKCSYLSSAPFDTYFYSYDSVTGVLGPVLGASPSACPANRVLRTTGRALYPGANPGVINFMVSVYDSESLLTGYIDPNAAVFAVYSTNTPYTAPRGVNPSTNIPNSGQPVYTQGVVNSGPVASKIVLPYLYNPGFAKVPYTNTSPYADVFINPNFGNVFEIYLTPAESSLTRLTCYLRDPANPTQNLAPPEGQILTLLVINGNSPVTIVFSPGTTNGFISPGPSTIPALSYVTFSFTLNGINAYQTFVGGGTGSPGAAGPTGPTGGFGGLVYSSIIPNQANTYDLGSLSSPFRDLYVSSGTIYVGGCVIDAVDGVLTLTNANGQPTNVPGYTGPTGPGTNYASISTIAIGQDAGLVNQGANGVAIGFGAGMSDQLGGVAIGHLAGQSTQGYYAIAIGEQAGQYAQANQSVALGFQAGQSNQGPDAIAIGVVAGASNQYGIAIGSYAGALNQGGEIAIGTYAAEFDQCIQAIAIGNSAGQFTQSSFGIAIGSSAGWSNQGTESIAIGHNAALLGQGDYSIAIGLKAGYSNQSTNAIAIGQNAGAYSQNYESIAIGFNAASTFQGVEAVAIGSGAGVSSQQDYSVAIGVVAGAYNQGIDSVALGDSAGYSNQSTFAVAVGAFAGLNSQGDSAIAVGTSAGSEFQGSSAVAVGTSAAYNFQGSGAVAIGFQAAYENQSAQSIAIGMNTGYYTQQDSAIAIGTNAGFLNQGSSAVAIGFQAAYENQSTQSIAIGMNAGSSNQQDTAIAIGLNAGCINQGTNAIAIGTYAGQVDQAVDSIAIGAGASAVTNGMHFSAGNTFFSLNPGGLRISPIANFTNSQFLTYNSDTNSVSYSAVAPSDIRLKTDVQDTSLGLEFIKQLRPIEYKWKDRGAQHVIPDIYERLYGSTLAHTMKPTPSAGVRIHQGFIAQDVSTLLSKVSGGKDYSMYSRELNPSTILYDLNSLNKDELIAPMVKAIQELTAQVESLQASVNTLLARV